MKLNELPIGKTATVVSIGGQGALRQHFLDMGIVPTAHVTMIKYAPMGDPIEIRIHSYELTLRLSEAQNIEIKDVRDTINVSYQYQKEKNHPGYGEKHFHSKKNEVSFSSQETLTFALVGNQNSGKTTLFNQLTGSSQRVGNFPGVTVDRKDGVIIGHDHTFITDLPGIYSISPYSSEELVTRDFILNEKPKAIINIVDATHIERNLYLTMQLMELDVPMVLALNMMDEISVNGGSILVNQMEELLGIPVVFISAKKNEGIQELIEHTQYVAQYQEKPVAQDYCDASKKCGAIHRAIHAIMHLIEDHALKENIPLRFAASRIIENDELILNKLHLDKNEKETLEHIIVQMEMEQGMDRAAAMAYMRFEFIKNVCEATVIKPKESNEYIKSQKIDRLLTGKYTAIPSFVMIMGLIFYLTFGVIGNGLSVLLEMGIEALTQFVEQILVASHVNAVIQSLVIDGIMNGIGSVVSFLPIIMTLFVFLSLLEDSGYMARIAFVMDKLLRKIGLSGRSIVPMLIGFGCSVPAVMSSRTLPSKRDRQMTILLIPFMSCTAKLPIYTFLTAAFFPRYKTVIMLLLYFGGIVVSVMMAFLFRKTISRGEAVPFVMELPQYRMPSFRNVRQLLWEKVKDFLQRAFTVIFIATLLIWFLQTFDLQLNVVTDSKESILATLASFITPIFIPLGFGDWKISTALMTGFMAKESVVSTLCVLNGTMSLTTLLSPTAAMSLLVFSLLYTPCIAAVTAIKRELGGRYALFVVFGQSAIAWIIAYIVYMIGISFY